MHFGVAQDFLIAKGQGVWDDGRDLQYGRDRRCSWCDWCQSRQPRMSRLSYQKGIFMRNPSNRIVGPEGDSGQDAREEFLLRCLNAAVNLHGVLSYGEFCKLYGRYAAGHEVPVSNPLSEDELDGFLAMAFASEEDDGSSIDGLIDQFGICFAAWSDYRTGERLIVKDALVDDQHGEPAIKRVLKRKKKLDDYDRAAAAYYENYRYTWLEVLAVKAGVGMKCRDLLTGEELFLMEKSLSLGDVKGMTVCAGIAPMGAVYLALGTIHPANFENPATILKIALTHLGLPTELPIRLDFADQARFAAETIRRINANGKFDNVCMGGQWY